MNEFKIVCIADAHLHQNNRLEDKVVALKKVSDYINKNNDVGMFVDLGDTFEVPNPIEEVRIVYANFLRSIREDCEVVKLKGNHETRDNIIYAFDSYFPENDEDEHMTVSVKGIHTTEVFGCNLVFCNYGHQGGIFHALGKQSEEDINILFAHLTVNGAQVNENYTMRNDGVNAKQYFKEFNYVFLGDIHKRQIHSNWRYIGALTKNNFGEAENEDGFSVITIDVNRHITEEFIKIPGREYIVIEYSEELGYEFSEEFINEYFITDNIVKVKITGSSEWFATLNRQKLIKEFEGLNPYRLLFEWNTTDIKKREAIEHNQNEQSQLEEYLKSNVNDEELAEAGVSYLEEILIEEKEK